VLSVWNVAMSASDTASTKRPVATTALLPNLYTQRVDIGAKIMSTIDCGRNTAPASTVEYPSTCCVYCVSRKMVPNNARNARVIAPLAAEKRGFSKNRTSRHRVRALELPHEEPGEDGSTDDEAAEHRR